MDIAETIIALQNAKGPDRKLDKQIALQLGFKRSVEIVRLDAKAPPAEKITWLKPDGTPGRILAYTRSVDTAIELAGVISPDNVGGCSWEKGRGSAKINEGPYVHGANPAIALCVAALQLLWAQRNPSNRDDDVDVVVDEQ